MKHRKNYTKNEKQIIYKFYKSLPKDKLLLFFPKRAWSNIQSKAWELGVHKYNINKKYK